MKIWPILAMTFLFSQSGLKAEELLSPQVCSEKLVSTENMPKNNVQGNLNWCFAWTASELLSFYEETPLSSYDLALQYHTHDDLRDNEVKDYTNVGGDNDIALAVAIQSTKGLCREKDTNFTNGDWKNLSELFKKLSAPNKTLQEIVCENNLLHTEPFENLNSEILLIINRLSHDKKVAALLDVTCKNRHKLKYRYGTGGRDIRDYPEDKLIAKLDELLNKNEPATLTLDIDFLSKGLDYKRKDDNHSATIIGKRPNIINGECEYLLKYTGGDQCPKKSSIECVDGNFWVPKKTLENNIYRINWLVKGPKK